MGKISVILPDDLENEFRKKAVEKFGWKKGTLSNATIDAIKLWLKQK